MAFVRWLLVAAMALVAALSVIHSSGVWPSSSASAAAVQYHCPMHPQVVQDHPGECPICGMMLVEREGGSLRGRPNVAPSDAREATPGSDEEVAGAHAGHRHEPSDPYFCPMHPEETGIDDDARCPICGMKLEARRATAPQPSGVTSPASPSGTTKTPAAVAPAEPRDVPGLAPIELHLDRIQSIGVRTAVAAITALTPELDAVGFVTPDETRIARVHSRFSGWIDELAVAGTGQKVARGQVLARLYNLELVPAQQELLTARAWSANPVSREAAGATALSPATFERDARVRLELLGMSASEIDHVAQAGQPLRTVGIAAPIAGHVVAKNAVRGAYVEPSTELFEIVDLSRVWVLADVYERDIGRVRVGQSAEVAVDAFPAQRFAGVVGLIYPTVDAATRTLRLRIELDNRGLALRPGMYGKVAIRLEPAAGVTIPSEALADTGEHQYVFLARAGGRFEPRLVRTGARAGDRVQILEGLAPGDVVVSTASFLIDSESRLRAAIEGTSSR
jgi:membrane fusion protein, copper/silver efflux system